MRSLIICASLLALLTAADAGPLYLKCDGKLLVRGEPEPATRSIKIDGGNVTVENFRPVPIPHEGGDVFTFGTPIFERPPPDQRAYGTLNRITGRFEFKVNSGARGYEIFEGVCRKTERLF
jgi:hypothetical protein